MSLRHPNIVTFIGYCYQKNNFYLVTEFMENKSLKYVLENKKISLTILDKLSMCTDISLAIFYLHSRSPLVLHRDLKSSNCLVNKNNKVKLCDFGLSKIYENSDRQTNSSSTCFWMAPEFIVKKIFNEKSDIYSLGILFWEIFMRDTIPYKGMNELTFLLGDIEVLKKRPIIPENFDKEIRALIESCWDMDLNKRPNISMVVDILEELIKKYSTD
jgi:serine/threonine protein kinase